jgi:hypothetical protein
MHLPFGAGVPGSCSRYAIYIEGDGFRAKHNFARIQAFKDSTGHAEVHPAGRWTLAADALAQGVVYGDAFGGG